MKITTFLAALLLMGVAALPLAAQENPPQEDPAATEEKSGGASAEEGEVAGRVEAMAEAFTEMKNLLDALNRLKISGYVQAQYVDDESSKDELSSPTSTKNRDQFSVRRGRLKLVYKATKASKVTVAFDAASSGVTLKDAFIDLTESRTGWGNTLTAGQFNWPFGFEIGYSSSDREMPERSRVVRTLFPGERDRGVMLSGAAPNGVVNYKLAVVNGTGTTQSFDFNSDKDFVGRVGLGLGRFDLGVSGYSGTDLSATNADPAGTEFDKTRYGADFQVVTPIPGLLTRGEYIVGEEKGSDVEGWYLYLIQNLGTKHQFVVRADSYDPNSDRGDNATMTLGGSYIYHFDEHAKVMLAYERPELEENDPDDNVATVRFQYKF